MSEGEAAPGREIWIEKYRPQTLSEIHGQEEIVERLESYIEEDDVPHMLFSGPAGVGKCVTGETPVVTGDGVRRIEDVVGDVDDGGDGFDEPDEGTTVATMTDRNEFEYVEPSHVFAQDADELVRVRTRDGGEFRVTPEHRFRVLNHDGFEWVPAAELSPDDRIARPLSLPTPEGDGKIQWHEEMDLDRIEVTLPASDADRYDFPETVPLAELHAADVDSAEWLPAVEQIEYVNVHGHRFRPIVPPTEITPELARFVALAISEASIDGGKIKFYNTDEELLSAFEATARDLFEVETTRGVQKGVPYVRIGSRTLTHFLKSTFDVFARAPGDSGIGSAILAADDASRAAFLRALFDAEAHVDRQGGIELTQRIPENIALMSYLLSTFGIPSRRKRVGKSATTGSGDELTYHTLYISGASALSRFRDRVGFTVEEKAARLAEHAEKESNPNYDTIPAQTVLRELCRRLDIPVTDYLPKTLDLDSPGRERYCEVLDDVVDEAATRVEKVQRALERLEDLEPELAAAAGVPARWIDARSEPEPIDVRNELSEAVGVRQDRLREYADGRRTPDASRSLAVLAEIDRSVEGAKSGHVRAELRECVDLIGAEYDEIADGLPFGASELTNLLRSENHQIESQTRFETVAERLREVAADRLSLETIELIDRAARIGNAELYYDRIDSVDRVEAEERVYDLTVPGTRNYVAGDVPTVVHNTTAATAIAREIYGDDWRGNFLELNASDERGIDVVRDRIKNFARSSFGGYDHRLIFLDEADSLTSDAQSALRRTMEQFSDNTRFILSCNYSSKIIDPIQSRCAVFRFSPLSDEAVAAQVREIADAEDIEITDDGVDALVYAADGDMRRAINSLQAAATTGDVVDEEAVYAITATARPEEIESMVTNALGGDFTKARATLDMLLTDTGMAGGDVIDQLHRSVWEFDLSDRETVRLMERIGEVDYRISEGANEKVQLESLLASLALHADGEAE